MSSDPPNWLARFVHTELRPLLVQRPQAALEALGRWLDSYDERMKQQAAWQARREEALRSLVNFVGPPPKEYSDGPTPEGYVWLEPSAWLDEGSRTFVGGLFPEELRWDRKPTFEFPLPPPTDRDLSPDERWAALLAVHDVCRVSGEQIGPADRMPFAPLCRRALELTEAHLPDLRAMLAKTHVGRPLGVGAPSGGSDSGATAPAAPLTDACPLTTPEAHTLPPTPLAATDYAIGWPEILKALHRRQGDKETVRGLNEKFNGPIRIAGQGSRPMADKAELIAWWNEIKVIHQTHSDEQAQRDKDRSATVSNQYRHGKEGHADTEVPDIAGRAKRRRTS